MIRKRKVIKHFAAEEEYADGKTKEDNLSVLFSLFVFMNRRPI